MNDSAARAAWDEPLRHALEERARAGLLRRLRPAAGGGADRFSSNDYLGLAGHPRLVGAARDAAARHGAGAGASRLICGNLPVHAALDEAFAAFKRRPAALAFANGYAAALGTIPALVEKGDAVLLDKRSHASLIDGARLSGAALRVFPHNDLGYLEKLLRTLAPKTRRILIVTESIFSMDGDAAPLREIAELKDRFGAWLMVDEAHATGLFGAGRRGLIEAEGLTERVEIQMATLGKALGSSGGVIAGSRALIDTLVNRARSLIYSTAPSPAACGAALEGLALVQEEEGAGRCRRLWSRVAHFLEAVDLPGASPIFPLIYGAEEEALAASAALAERGWALPPIRHPTVARGRARLRVTLTADRTEEEIDALVAALRKSAWGFEKATGGVGRRDVPRP